MNRVLVYFLLLLLITSIISCKKNDVKGVISGGWTIDTLWNKDYEIRLCLVGNYIELKSDGSCILPVTKNYCPEAVMTFETFGNWTLDQKSMILHVKTKNAIFNGNNKISFRNDVENKLLVMVVDSKDLHMVCRKMLFSYDENLDLVNSIIAEAGNR